MRMNGLSISGQDSINLNIYCMLGKMLLYSLIFYKKYGVLKGMLIPLYFIKYLNHNVLWTCSSHKKIIVNQLN